MDVEEEEAKDGRCILRGRCRGCGTLLTKVVETTGRAEGSTTNVQSRSLQNRRPLPNQYKALSGKRVEPKPVNEEARRYSR